MAESLRSLKDILAQFRENKSESEYGLQLEASLTLPLDLTIYHVPILDADGEATGQFTDRCVVELSCGFDTELRGIKTTSQNSKGQPCEEQSGFLTALLHYDNDRDQEGHGVYLEDIIAALELDETAPVWSIQEAE
jgi:hypothetical protein